MHLLDLTFFHLHGIFLHLHGFAIVLAADLISHHLLQVNAGYRLAAANALKHAFFEV